MFMLDMDELVYQFGLSERWRTRMESTGRVELDDVEADRLARTKVVHVVLITLLGLAFVYAAGPFRRPERKTPAANRRCTRLLDLTKLLAQTV